MQQARLYASDSVIRDSQFPPNPGNPFFVYIVFADIWIEVYKGMFQ